MGEFLRWHYFAQAVDRPDRPDRSSRSTGPAGSADFSVPSDWRSGVDHLSWTIWDLPLQSQSLRQCVYRSIPAFSSGHVQLSWVRTKSGPGMVSIHGFLADQRASIPFKRCSLLSNPATFLAPARALPPRVARKQPPAMTDRLGRDPLAPAPPALTCEAFLDPNLGLPGHPKTSAQVACGKKAVQAR